MSILSIKDVSKTYHNHQALNKVNLEISKGSIFGLLGPNGAGKTSLIRIITGITMADSGSVYLDGELLGNHHPNQIGYMPEERGLYKKMKVAEQLLYLAQLKGLSKSEAEQNIKMWFDKLDMGTWWNKKVDELSKGMSQKVQFVATVVHKPKLIILDEPFSGLDPLNADILKDEIYKLNKQGASIIFSTHRMEQVEEICDDIALVNKGHILLNDSISNVRQKFKENEYSITSASPLPTIQSDQDIEVEVKDNHTFHFKVKSDKTSNQILSSFIANDINIKAYYEVLPSLNQIFISLVKNDTIQ